jgi:DNA polymerase II small subunit
MDDIEIISRFLEGNLNLHPLALEELKKMDDSEIERILSKLTKLENKNVITVEQITILKKNNGSSLEKNENNVVVFKKRKRALAEEYDAELRIKNELDITNRSFSNGDIQGFVKYFQDRFEKISNILRVREQLKDAANIEDLRRRSRDDVRLIGMISDIRWSKKGHLLLELEDLTGTITVLLSKNDGDLLKVSNSLVKDEVIGVVGRMWNDMVIAEEILFPDLPINKEANKSDVPLCLALISDIHMGSTKFLEEVFTKFIKWLKGEMGSLKHKNLAERIKYLLIGGDLVDGVGVYPGQEKELVIKDITQQYKRVADFLEEIPDYIEIIVLPGNHDAVRQAEPQPAISQDFAPRFYENSRFHMVGNPCRTTFHGVEVLSYHGRSLDDIISTLPDHSYSKPEKAMLELLRKRHLTPIYGGKIPLAPESMDYMVIEDLPDILHLGHVHHYGWAQYRGVTLINSGTFQDQTSFQRKLNMIPTPGKVPIIDLSELKTIKMEFL